MEMESTSTQITTAYVVESGTEEPYKATESMSSREVQKTKLFGNRAEYLQ